MKQKQVLFGGIQREEWGKRKRESKRVTHSRENVGFFKERTRTSPKIESMRAYAYPWRKTRQVTPLHISRGETHMCPDNVCVLGHVAEKDEPWKHIRLSHYFKS